MGVNLLIKLEQCLADQKTESLRSVHQATQLMGIRTRLRPSTACCQSPCQSEFWEGSLGQYHKEQHEEVLQCSREELIVPMLK